MRGLRALLVASLVGAEGRDVGRGARNAVERLPAIGTCVGAGVGEDVRDVVIPIPDERVVVVVLEELAARDDLRSRTEAGARSGLVLRAAVVGELGGGYRGDDLLAERRRLTARGDVPTIAMCVRLRACEVGGLEGDRADGVATRGAAYQQGHDEQPRIRRTKQRLHPDGGGVARDLPSCHPSRELPSFWAICTRTARRQAWCSQPKGLCSRLDCGPHEGPRPLRC